MSNDAVRGDRELLSGWGNTPRSVAVVRHPGDADQVRAIAEEQASRPLLARGLGRSYGDASLNSGGTVIDMSALDRIEPVDADGTVTVDGGTSLDGLLRAIVPTGYFLPVTPGTRFVTVGGALAADVHGKNHHADGSIQEFVASFDLLVADGRTLTVTRESAPETFAATMGGLGLTGVVTSVTLRLLPVETAFMRVSVERTPGLEATIERFRESDRDYRYSVAWVDCLARGKSLGRSVLGQANHARMEDLDSESRREPLTLVERAAIGLPQWMPGGLLRPATLKLFNEAVYRRGPAAPGERIEGILPYFYPLDGVRNWNHAYGARGFVQYQFVVPDGEETVLRDAIRALQDAGCPSYFAVLKRMGPGRGMLSFPMAGWTLALDMPAGRPALGDVLDRLDSAVAEAGGRVYLAKDARMRPESVSAMYPELERWRVERNLLDPGGRWRSDLARRLDLL